ncbi:hypothetical protein QUB33_07640 [Microcoleus sp. B3-A4]|uniref:hypothetical protein n=1 Tax=Microcoleus sp. B3-A4 TaxID=2818653 RepID=UPI002FD4BAA7
MNVEPPETLVIIESIVYKSNGFAIATKVKSREGALFDELISKITLLVAEVKKCLINNNYDRKGIAKLIKLSICW